MLIGSLWIGDGDDRPVEQGQVRRVVPQWREAQRPFLPSAAAPVENRKFKPPGQGEGLRGGGCGV